METGLRSGAPKGPTRTLLIVCGVVILSACSDTGAEDSGSNPYYKDVVAAGEDPQASDFEREVFSDGKVTRAEYEAAVDRLVACGEARGVTIGVIPAGDMYNYSIAGASERADAIMTECSVGTTMDIESLYEQIVVNPERDDINQLVAECFVRSGLVDDYTANEYRYAKEQSGTGGSGPDFPFDPEDPRRFECEQNPSSH